MEERTQTEVNQKSERTSSMKQEIVKAALLIEDFDLYPRADVDSTHVSHIVDALEAGVELPAIIACRKSKRIVDGFHRRRAYMTSRGKDCDVPVEWRDYKTDANLFEEAMRLNSNHGRNITTSDRMKCVLTSRKLGLGNDAIANALNVSVERLEVLVDKLIVKVDNTRHSEIGRAHV